MRGRLWLGAGGAFVAALLFLVASYSVGHRSGRGAMCFEAAINLPDSRGETLKSKVLQLPESRSDYSFWGTHCTISIGFMDRGALRGGRWRFEPATGRLWADSDEAEELFPASGRWKLPGTL